MSDEHLIPKVKALVDQLFTNGQGDQAVRLVLELPGNRDGGGWCRKAVSDRIAAAFAEAEAHIRALESELEQAREEGRHEGLNQADSAKEQLNQ